MRVRVITEFETAKGVIPIGQIIEIPETLLSKLAGKVEPVTVPAAPPCQDRQAPKQEPTAPSGTPPNWRPELKAWLTESGELRTTGVFDDLAGEIVRLTADNLPLQAILLRRHVGEYSGPAWEALTEHWQERAAIMEYDGKMDRATAEYEAAKLYRAEAFLNELRETT